jgi:hypothetical protein
VEGQEASVCEGEGAVHDALSRARQELGEAR